MEYTWKIFGIITFILLVIYWGKRNAVWGGLTAGIIIGLIVAMFSEFNWYVVVKGAILGTVAGFIAEMLGKVSDFIKQKK